MKKDIPVIKVEDIIVAAVPMESDPLFWEVYVINLQEDDITDVLITSRGYGERDNEKVETTTLRYFVQKLDSLDYVKIEIISSEVFDLANEYWISFRSGGHMLDKKYVFVTGSLTPENFTLVPFISRNGVMIR